MDTDDCYPLSLANKSGEVPKPIVPCGAIANSMFNGKFFLFLEFDFNSISDTFNMTYHSSNNFKTQTVLMTSDKLLPINFRQQKYKNPKKCTNEDEKCPGFEGTAKPPAWRKPIEELGDSDTGKLTFCG